MPQGNLAERLRAAGAGIGAFFTPTGYSTELTAGKERREIEGRNYVLEYPLRGDVALIKELRADEQLAQLVAADIAPGSFVNLGIGQTTKVSDNLDAEKTITLHTENGMLGMGPATHGDEVDDDLINAGKLPVTELRNPRLH